MSRGYLRHGIQEAECPGNPATHQPVGRVNHRGTEGDRGNGGPGNTFDYRANILGWMVTPNKPAEQMNHFKRGRRLQCCPVSHGPCGHLTDTVNPARWDEADQTGRGKRGRTGVCRSVDPFAATFWRTRISISLCWPRSSKTLQGGRVKYLKAAEILHFPNITTRRKAKWRPRWVLMSWTWTWPCPEADGLAVTWAATRNSDRVFEEGGVSSYLGQGSHSGSEALQVSTAPTRPGTAGSTQGKVWKGGSWPPTHPTLEHYEDIGRTDLFLPGQ